MTTDYDSILTAQDSNFINKSDIYKAGKGMPDHGIPVAEHPYVVAKDDYLLGGVFVMFLIMALVVYRNRVILLSRLKDFFVSKRKYSDENINENNKEPYTIFFLTSISALSLSLVFFDYTALHVGFSTVLGIPYWLFAAGYVFFIIFVYLKAWLYALVNWVFFDRESSTRWLTGYLLLTALTAFVIFPLSLTVVVAENSRTIVTWGLVFTLILYEFLLFFRMFVNFDCKNYGYLLIFLYFCTVEAIPIVVMSRIMMWVIDLFVVKNILY